MTTERSDLASVWGACKYDRRYTDLPLVVGFGISASMFERLQNMQMVW